MACGASCTSADECQTQPCTSGSGWVTAYCAPRDAGWQWSTSPGCDDPANLCDRGNTCQSGACTGGTTVQCVIDACHGACDPALGACAIEVGASCDDGDACTTDDACQSDGACAGVASGTPIHRYSNIDACDWYYLSYPGAGWDDDGVVFRSAPGGDETVAQLFDPDSLGRPLTTDAGAWSSVGSFGVEEADVVTAFSSSQPGSVKLVRYRFVAGPSCNTDGWARYVSILDGGALPELDAGQNPGGFSVSTTPPGVPFVDTDIWVCPP